MSQYFEVGVRIDKMADDGTVKKVKEVYIVDSLSFTEAESKTFPAAAKSSNLTNAEIDIDTIKRTPYAEIVDKDKEGKFYQVKISFIGFDYNSGKENKMSAYYLVVSDSVDNADNAIKERLKGSMLDCVIERVSETKIVELVE